MLVSEIVSEVGVVQRLCKEKVGVKLTCGYRTCFLFIISILKGGVKREVFVVACYACVRNCRWS